MRVLVGRLSHNGGIDALAGRFTESTTPMYRILIILWAGMLSACTVLPGLNIDVEQDHPDYRLVEIDGELIGQLAALSLNEAEFEVPAAGQRAEGEAYRIGPGDVVSVIVWGHPELTTPSGEFRDPVQSGRLVSENGIMYYPHVGEFRAAGMTVSDLRRSLSQQLSRVIQDPQVDVRVVAFRAHRVQVTGEVLQPGVVTLDDTRKGVLEAINERGGVTAEGSRGHVTLIRDGARFPISLDGTNAGGGTQVPFLAPGDLIYVPSQSETQVFVLGKVDVPQPLGMRVGRMSLIEALTRAGGLDDDVANDGAVYVFRSAPSARESVPQVYALDLSRPEGVLLAGSFNLKPRDVVYVAQTDFARYNSVIGQLLPTVTAIFQLDRLTLTR